MALTALEIKDKKFGVKFRGYDANEVEEFLNIVVSDYEDPITNDLYSLEKEISALIEWCNNWLALPINLKI